MTSYLRADTFPVTGQTCPVTAKLALANRLGARFLALLKFILARYFGTVDMSGDGRFPAGVTHAVVPADAVVMLKL